MSTRMDSDEGNLGQEFKASDQIRRASRELLTTLRFRSFLNFGLGRVHSIAVLAASSRHHPEGLGEAPDEKHLNSHS